ncbi:MULTISPECIES: alpha/beta hydrolase [Arthrobacter]|uniref:alpha/beta hydrolase n=1 Tax=Arthrobacter TaxID=1663 RepID=UPI001D158ED8|nr:MULTISPECIES: alpha/beta fold hydrolase [Arthrobacter]MCC3283835.1 alpha/beta hydrolase [Arthrobacter caoxuetaonis]MCC9193273.1 alpha/beta hydrolase [Arthrobacter sp. zg-Y916]
MQLSASEAPVQAVSAQTASWVKWTAFGAGMGMAASTAVLAATSGLAVYFARQIVTPRRARDENLEILAVIDTPEGQQIILPANADTTAEGSYGLYFDGGTGYARIGAIRSYVPREGTVQRDVERVYSGDLATAVRGWWSGTIHPTPSDAGFPQEDVEIDVENGKAPAWLVRSLDATDTWAIMVHGRGAQRTETIRGLGAARSAGMTSLLISYRNDGEAPYTSDGRYGLGLTEWRDVEAAIRYALDHGARDVVLFGWSMGGAIALQTADKSPLGRHIRALVLDGPVVNWVEVLAHHARLNRIPAQVGRLGQWLISNAAGRTLTGLAAPLDLKSMDWVARAEEIRTPVLIVHSERDEFVPVGPSADLAEKNPDLVTFVRFPQGGHTREYNTDPVRWEDAVAGWLRTALGRTRRPGEHR